MESISHALLQCNHAKQTWSYWSDCPVDLSLPNQDLISIVTKIIEKGKIGIMPFTAMLATPLVKLEKLLNDPWQTSIPPTYMISLFFPQSELIGLHPFQVIIKLFVDGVTTNDGASSSISVIIRDHTGATVGALNKLLPTAFPAPVTEAYALLQGVLFAAEMGTSNAIFESDALALVQAVNANEFGGDIGHIIQDIKSATLAFSWSSFQHLKREGNKVAHELARDAKLMGHSHTWKGVSPPFIQKFLLDDLL